MMKKIVPVVSLFFFATTLFAQRGKDSTITKKDRKKDLLLQTSMGDIIIRLSDSTPLHRDNFLKLVKVGFTTACCFTGS